MNNETSENSRERNINTRIYELYAVAFPKMLAGVFTNRKQHFYLSENNREREDDHLLLFPHIAKIWAKKYSSVSSHFNPKIVGDNRPSEQIFTEKVCWVPLFKWPQYLGQLVLVHQK